MTLITALVLLCLVGEMMCPAALTSDSSTFQITDVPANEVLRAPPNVAQPTSTRDANGVQDDVWTASVAAYKYLAATDVFVTKHIVQQRQNTTTAVDNIVVYITAAGSYEKTGSSPATPMVHVGASNNVSAKFSVVTEGSPVLIHSNDSCWMIPSIMATTHTTGVIIDAVNQYSMNAERSTEVIPPPRTSDGYDGSTKVPLMSSCGTSLSTSFVAATPFAVLMETMVHTE